MNRKQRKAHGALWPALIVCMATVTIMALAAKARIADATARAAGEQ